MRLSFLSWQSHKVDQYLIAFVDLGRLTVDELARSFEFTSDHAVKTHCRHYVRADLCAKGQRIGVCKVP